MFFLFSKILWFVLMPFNLAIFALTGAMVAMWLRRHRVARGLGIAAWILLVVFGVLPTGRVLLGQLEAQNAAPDPMPRRIAGVIVLGGAIDSDIALSRGRPQLNASADRIIAFTELGRRYPWAKLVYTGGVGAIDQEGMPEGQMVRETLGSYGFYPGPRLLIEDKSRTTAENAVYSRELAKPLPGQVWLLVTSAWHMPRALGAFRQQGWEVVPYPADYLTPGKGGRPTQGGGFLANMQLSQIAIKEWLGIAVYALSGKWTSGGVAPVDTR